MKILPLINGNGIHPVFGRDGSRFYRVRHRACQFLVFAE